MARTLSTALTTEMNSLTRTSAAQVTVERWQPEWTARLSGLSAGELERYAHGHAAAVYPDGNGAGEDILLRARSGSYANPQDGKLYVAVIKGSDLAAPTTWDSLFVDSGKTGLMYPAWTANSGAAYGGSLAAAVWDNSGTPTGRLFYFKSTGALVCVDVNLLTGAVGSETTIASLGTGVQLSSMQVAASSYTEIFVLIPQLVESGLAAWHQDVYGSFIRRYSYSGSWTTDNSFFFHTHAEAGLLRDTPTEGSDFGDAASDGVRGQWGRRFCGGLAAHELDPHTVLVSAGLTFWRRWGYYTHSQGLASFIYHRDSSWWERGPEAGEAAFNDDIRLNFDTFVRDCTVEARQFLIWNRFLEPSDYEQTPTSLTIPRLEEVVLARLSADGQYLTEPQYLGDPAELTGASVVVVNHGGSKALYALGWRSVYESEPAALICTVDSPTDLDDSCQRYTLNRNNRQGMTLSLALSDPTPLTDPAGAVQSGRLARAWYGVPGELVQVGQGLVEVNTPSLTVSAAGQFSEGATVACAADELLLKTRAQALGDVHPQQTVLIAPGDPVEHVSESQGEWSVAAMSWPNLFFPTEFAALNGQTCYRLSSFPPAQTGADLLKSRYGSWFKDISWLELPPMVDGMIETSLRFGDPFNQANFTFKATNNTQMYTTLNRSNGVITSINWRTGGYTGPIWNTVAQSAVMGGLLCHAAEIGRKYAFVWEYNSTFSVSSHTDDTWTAENFDRADYSAHGTGSNKLYLIVSDFDGSDWVHKSVAGITATGLTAGKPADLRMQVIGGTIYCFYRLHSTGTPNQWRYAFSHQAARFGAGQFGVVGRGHLGIVWSLLKPGEAKIARTANVVDFWNIRLSDAAVDRTLAEHLARHSWRGFTATAFSDTVRESSRAVAAGTSYSYDTPVENLAIDFKVSIPASGNEAGVFVRGMSQASPTAECIKLGLVAHNTANSATAETYYYLVKRSYLAGAEVTSAREYAPLCLHLKPGQAVPVRVTVVGAVYSIWLAGNYAGHFLDETELGLYFGLYASGGTATFSDIRVPELYEVPAVARLEANQAMSDAINDLIGRRRIKGIFQYDGSLQFGYFEMRASGPAFTENQLWQSSLQKNPRYLSTVRVQGANNAYAIYQAAALARRGIRYELVTNPEISQREFAYREARLMVSELAEQQEQSTFTGLPDLRVEPEDEIDITLSRQNVAGTFIVDDVALAVEFGEQPRSSMQISTRQQVAL